MVLDPGVHRILTDALVREGWPKPARRHPADRGGLTRGGITAANWGSWAGLGRAATAEELDALTDDDAIAFYYERYVRLPGYEAVQDPALRAILIDWAFTSWHDDPTKALQRSYTVRGLYTGAIDGVFGPKTRAAAEADPDPRRTFRDVFNARVRFYMHAAFDADVLEFLRQNDRTQLHFCRGWINRCLEFTP